MAEQMKDYLDNYSLLPDVQSGLRKGYICSTALLHIADEILRATDEGL